MRPQGDSDTVLATREKLRVPRAYVREVYAALVAGGYLGPAPDHGATWDQLFRPIRALVGGRRLAVS